MSSFARNCIYQSSSVSVVFLENSPVIVHNQWAAFGWAHWCIIAQQGGTGSVYACLCTNSWCEWEAWRAAWSSSTRSFSSVLPRRSPSVLDQLTTNILLLLFALSELMHATEAVTSLVYCLVGRPGVAVQHLIQQGLCNLPPCLLHDWHFAVFIRHLFFFSLMCRCVPWHGSHVWQPGVISLPLDCLSGQSAASSLLTELLLPHT